MAHLLLFLNAATRLGAASVPCTSHPSLKTTPSSKYVMCIAARTCLHDATSHTPRQRCTLVSANASYTRYYPRTRITACQHLFASLLASLLGICRSTNKRLAAAERAPSASTETIKRCVSGTKSPQTFIHHTIIILCTLFQHAFYRHHLHPSRLHPPSPFSLDLWPDCILSIHPEDPPSSSHSFNALHRRRCRPPPHPLYHRLPALLQAPTRRLNSRRSTSSSGT